MTAMVNRREEVPSFVDRPRMEVIPERGKAIRHREQSAIRFA
jgi:hypothetical protein